MSSYKAFRITYIDPETQEADTIIKEFEEFPNLSAKLQAEDLAYSLSDKGHYEIKDLTRKETF